MTSSERPADLALEFLTLHDHLQSGVDDTEALRRLVRLAPRVVPSCEWASVTRAPSDRVPYSLMTSSEVAAELDRLQYDLGEGPGLAAAASGTSDAFLARDVAVDVAWPKFVAAAAARTPVRAAVAFHLADVPHPSAFNFYSRDVDGFDADAIGLAALFVAHARRLLLGSRSEDRMARQNGALSTSRQIGTAVGVLMTSQGLTGDEAFDLLRRSSRTLLRTVADIADEVSTTGRLPDSS